VYLSCLDSPQSDDSFLCPQPYLGHSIRTEQWTADRVKCLTFRLPFSFPCRRRSAPIAWSPLSTLRPYSWYWYGPGPYFWTREEFKVLLMYTEARRQSDLRQLGEIVQLLGNGRGLLVLRHCVAEMVKCLQDMGEFL